MAEILPSTPKHVGMIIITGIWICTDILGNLKTGKDSKEQLRRQNKTSLTEKSTRLPIRSMVPRNL